MLRNPQRHAPPQRVFGGSTVDQVSRAHPPASFTCKLPPFGEHVMPLSINSSFFKTLKLCVLHGSSASFPDCVLEYLKHGLRPASCSLLTPPACRRLGIREKVPTHIHIQEDITPMHEHSRRTLVRTSTCARRPVLDSSHAISECVFSTP